MNEKEINGAFDREYEKYKNSPEYKEGFVKLKMPTYYIAKHSDEDLQAAVQAEREACAEHYLAIMRDAVEQAVVREREACAKLCEEREEYQMPIPCPDGITGCCVAHFVRGSKIKDGKECAAAIRARGEK